MVEDILSKVRSDLLSLGMALRSFIEAIIPPQCLPFSLILLKEKRRCSELIHGTGSTHTNRHTALLSIKHQFLLVQLLLDINTRGLSHGVVGGTLLNTLIHVVNG